MACLTCNNAADIVTTTIDLEDSIISEWNCAEPYAPRPQLGFTWDKVPLLDLPGTHLRNMRPFIAWVYAQNPRPKYSPAPISVMCHQVPPLLLYCRDLVIKEEAAAQAAVAQAQQQIQALQQEVDVRIAAFLKVGEPCTMPVCHKSCLLPLACIPAFLPVHLQGGSGGVICPELCVCGCVLYKGRAYGGIIWICVSLTAALSQVGVGLHLQKRSSGQSQFASGKSGYKIGMFWPLFHTRRCICAGSLSPRCLASTSFAKCWGVSVTEKSLCWYPSAHCMFGCCLT